jgi:hypothetical protein
MLTVVIIIVLWSGIVTYNYMSNSRTRVKGTTGLRGSIFDLCRQEYIS